MYNLRYHIASLVAVFLALSVGLLLGTVVVERGVLNTQKTALVSGLQKEYDALRTTSSDLRKQADTLSAFAVESEPRVVADALSGRTVIVIADAGSGEAVQYAVDTLRQAGATPAVATLASSGLALGDASVLDAVSKATGVAQASVTETAVVEELAREWTTQGGVRPLTAALVSSGALRLDGFASTAAVDGAVVAAIFAEKPDAASLALAAAIAGPGRHAVGVETTKRATGMAAKAVAAGLSGVDDIDQPLGRVSLVWTLAGKASGLFGEGKGTSARYPSPLFPTQ